MKNKKKKSKYPVVPDYNTRRRLARWLRRERDFCLKMSQERGDYWDHAVTAIDNVRFGLTGYIKT